MKRVIVASTNPVKLDAVCRGFQKMFPGEEFRVDGVAAPSGVPAQPLSDAETRRGAFNRASHACVHHPGADYYAGVEGGVEDLDGELCAFAWVCIRSGEVTGKARTAAFFLPAPVAELVRSGMELGEADDRIFGRVNSKQENGAVGILTANVIDRSNLYEPAVVLALIPFKNEGQVSISEATSNPSTGASVG